MAERPPTIALYLRVSSQKQAREGTIETQRATLRRLAATRGLCIVAEYADDGRSGTLPPEARPGLKALLATCADEPPGWIGTVDFSRLSRADEIEQARLRALLRTTGCPIATTTGADIDLSTPDGRMMATVTGALATRDRELLLAKTFEGLRRAASEGRWAGGPVPYGYRLDRDTGRLAVVEAEAEVVRQIYTWAATLSGVRIASRLNEQGIPAPGGGPWRTGGVYLLLRRPIYRGAYLWGDCPGRPYAGGNVVAEGQVAPIVDAATWRAAIDALVRRRRERNRDGREPYLLAGLIRCAGTMPDGAECGATWTGTQVAAGLRNPNRLRYYRCGAADRSRAGRWGRQPCGCKHVRTEALDELVWGEVLRLARDPAVLRAAVALAEGGGAGPAGGREAEIRELEARRAGLLEALARAGTGILQGLALQVTVARVEADVAAVDARLRALRQAKEREARTAEQAARFAAQARHLAEDSPPAVKREALLALFGGKGQGIWFAPGGTLRLRGELALGAAAGVGEVATFEVRAG